MRASVAFRCETCGKRSRRGLSQVKYRRKPPRFCSLKCSGASRRLHKTKAQKAAEKAAYDREYRAKNVAKLAAYKAAWFQRTYDPEAARKERRRRMKAHVEYCRRYYADPAKKAAKVAYDQARRDGEYGPFAEAHRLSIDLKRAFIQAVPDKYERLKLRGYFDRDTAQQRKRDAQISRW